eukprot:NODE_18967_length_278_cov_1.698690_g17799_i0.p4 GENE.NODE_18967_length_278_cov_1.698690_g17799_i0~~NODE_18967_length_278_cov_1.698690_g17799_i0.p4  ORF type:complete len:62 (-),score=1.38 NODE_18967_length_278_cov_1.698690_g17799_i0:72-257(-)
MAIFGLAYWASRPRPPRALPVGLRRSKKGQKWPFLAHFWPFLAHFCIAGSMEPPAMQKTHF